MKVLFVASGNHGHISPVVKAQGDSLKDAGVEVDYFLIKGKGIAGYLSNIRPLNKYCLSNRFDIVHAHYSFSAFVASLSGVRPLVVSLMGSDVKATDKRRKLIRLFCRIFKWLVIIVKSKDMERGLGLGNRVRVIPNGVDTRMFVPMDKAICQAKLGWKEGVRHILFPANPDRPEKDFALASRAVELSNLSGEIHFFKEVEHKETVYYYNACDVVLLTSKWEGSPNVIKEALACGCPIVSVDVGDVRERITGIDGCYLAETREPQELAVLLRKAMIFEGRTEGRRKIFVDGMDNKQVVQRLITIYETHKRSE